MPLDLFQLVANWGVPSILAVLLVWYLLTRFERVLERLDKQIELNTVILARMAGLDIEQERQRIANGRV